MTLRIDPIGSPSSSSADLASRRPHFAELQSQAEEHDQRELASAYRRLGLLTEVWECLRDSSPVAATEVATFCDEVVTRLQSCDSGEVADAAAWTIRDSSARWGDYLGLIDPGDDASGLGTDSRGHADEPLPPPAALDDEASQVDAATLFRLLTGTAPSSPSPAVDRRAKPARPAVNLAQGGLLSPSTSAGFRLGSTPPRPARAESALFPTPGVSAAHGPAAIEPESDLSPAPSPLIAAAMAPPSPPAPTPARAPVEPPTFVVPAIDAELRDTFLAEASDLFDRLEGMILSLNRGGDANATLHELGRCFHTLKGAAGSVDLTQVVFHIHETEERIEGAAGVVSDALIDSLHKTLQYLEGVFLALRRGGGSAPAPSYDPPPAPTPPPQPVAPPPVRPAQPIAASTAPSPFPSITAPEAPREPAPAPPPPASSAPAKDTAPAGEGPVRVSAERIDELMDLVSDLITRRALWAAQSDTMKEFASTARACRTRLLSTIDRLRDLHPEGRPLRNALPSRSRDDRDSNVDGLLRRLVEQTDDLVVLAETAQAAAKPLADNSDTLARQTLQLWEALQSIRIVPVKGLFQRLTRVAHDAARFEGRQVEVVTIGEETGLDRAIQDKAFEPLLHVVRNAVCHGIEAPDERTKAGKSPVGRVTLEASRAGNTLVLAVNDDGRGLDYEAIAAKGRRLGLIGPEDRPGVERLNALVFQPGFSTRDSANAIAGRGVGMDVVAQEVARLHGSVSLTSQRGRGTRLSLSLPARLALEQVMVVRVNGQPFALPVGLIERAEPFESGQAEGEGAGRRLRLGGEPIPLLCARDALGLPAGAAPCPMVLVVHADGEPLALLVESIDGTSELVIKPLGSLLSGHPIVSGVALSVQGEVVFTLSPTGLARWQREAKGPSCSFGNSAEPGRAEGGRHAPVLLVDDSLSVRKVVARQLRSLGFEVEEVSDGLEALVKIRSTSYCLVLTDLEMPRMDGFELIAELVRSGVSPTTPILMASTRSDPETRRKAAALGASDFLSKPIAPEELASKVRVLLGDSATTSTGPSHAAKEPVRGTHEQPSPAVL